MKNKLLMLVLPLLSIILFPGVVDAAGMSVSIRCSDVTIGSTTKCIVSANSGTTKISSINASYSITGGASFVSFAPGSGWNGEASGGTMDLYTDVNKSGTFTIGTFTLKGTSVGTVTFTVSNITGYDNNFEDVPVSLARATFKVIQKTTTTTTTKKPTTKPTTTTRSTGKTTTRKTTTNKNNNSTTGRTTTNRNNNSTTGRTTTIPGGISTTGRTTTDVNFNTTTTKVPPLRLTSVTVDDFFVKYENGTYYVTVKPDTEVVNVSATAAPGISIIGAGKRYLAIGKNSVELVLKSELGQTNKVQIIITRPDANGIYDTQLVSLKVVDYPFAFNPDIKEYEITVPYTTKELYVLANSYSDDVVITGGGLVNVEKGNNTIYIKVTYGDLAATEYKITVKKSYTMIIMWASIGTLGIICLGLFIYAHVNKKAAVEKAVAEKNKIIAAGNRVEASASPVADVQFNGQNVVGVGRKTVVPTKVTEPVIEEKKKDVVNTQPKVTQVASQPVKAPTMVSTAPQPQVKVIKKTVVPQQTQVQTIKVSPITSNGAYGNDDIVITDIEK